MGKTIVRGINADHWRACLVWSKPNATFTLDYYFTGKTSVPHHATEQCYCRGNVKLKCYNKRDDKLSKFFTKYNIYIDIIAG